MTPWWQGVNCLSSAFSPLIDSIYLLIKKHVDVPTLDVTKKHNETLIPDTCVYYLSNLLKKEDKVENDEVEIGELGGWSITNK